MQSKNPVLSKVPAFQASPYPGQPYADSDGSAPYAGQPYAGQTYPGQTCPGQPYPGQPTTLPQPFVNSPGTMTIDDVLAKTAITLGLLIASAVVSFWVLGRYMVSAGSFSTAALAVPSVVAVVTGLVAFGTVFVMNIRRAVKPGFILVYSVIEGVFIGAISLIFEFLNPGIVLPAAFGTFVAAGVTLAAYKFLRIKVSSKFRRMVVIGTMAIAGVYLVNLVLSLFGVNLGIVSVTGAVSPLAILFSIVGVGLAVFNLILDFDYIEQGVRAGAPASESWRGAFGLTVTMVWLYVELLRILSYFNRR